ncbi:inorganic phosphate transporter [Pleurocapsa sp. PCC 7319]|uniref:inorganic phosphate transporter n=1 Tax=Pleurocapsa sp. PCC 7319 TaxID=118161 RepID=UPI000348740D|nr:inorganic phosphate transporter [Pleurocapsa sp. PCC 7319]
MSITIIPLILISLLAAFVAWNLGANDVANSMGTSVGSKAITLTQAIIIAGILEFTGAVLFGQQVSATIATKVANSQLFIDTPQQLLVGMIAVLLSCGIWLQIATSQGLPVASSHAVVGAIAGFSWVAIGKEAIAWSNIGFICLGWIVTPVISAMVAASLYSFLRYWLFEQQNVRQQLWEWIPWLSGALISIFGIIVLPSIVQLRVFNYLLLPEQTLSLGIGLLFTTGITFYSWNQLNKYQQKNLRHQLKTPLLEKIMGKFQLLSACFVAFAHGSNDVGNAIAPLAVIVYVLQTNAVPINNLDMPIWIMVLGGLGIVGGLAVQGKNVIATVGENIISLVPSTGFCAELATATTILIASRIGLPVSTSHALVGSVIGIGLISSNQKVRWSTIKSVVLAWVVTLPVAAILSAIIFSLLLLLL